MKNRSFLIAFTAGFVALGAVHCIFGLNDESLLVAALTKILPLLLLTAMVCIYGFRPLVVAALVTSMCGDVAAEILALGEFRMPLQIAFFSIAQICYALDFLKFKRPRNDGRVKFKRPRSDGRVLSVLPFMMGFYGLLELFAIICASLQERRQKWSFVLGASLFIVSDAIILARVLTGGFPFADLLVMITYYLAQYFLNIPLLTSRR